MNLLLYDHRRHACRLHHVKQKYIILKGTKWILAGLATFLNTISWENHKLVSLLLLSVLGYTKTSPTKLFTNL